MTGLVERWTKCATGPGGDRLEGIHQASIGEGHGVRRPRRGNNSQKEQRMSLEALKPELSALPAEQLRSPNIPMASALQEASDLAELCRRSNIHDAMVAVGLPGNFVADLDQRVGAARQAQSIWVSARDQTKSRTLVELEARATELRSELVAAGRYNLRNDPEAQATLSSIRGGETVADLVQDLFDLGTVYEGHLDAFAADQSFDAPARVAEARAVAQELSQSISDERLDP
ncbi:MAG: hypothetical protein JW940_04350, partial [Polyangiaceae bacterium]|nr:hypothetical protein [Polyangiaceae bacterium]